MSREPECECCICEAQRARHAANVNYRSALEAKYGRSWTSEELIKDFEVRGFSASLCVVVRRSDKTVGTLDFTHYPRYYFSFKADK